jgi:anti-sigma B factor antagonist
VSAADNLDGTPWVTAKRVGAALVLAVGGDVDHATIPEVRAGVAKATAGDAQVVVLDLSAVTFLDSAGLALMVNLHVERPGRLRVVAPMPIARRPIELTGLDQVLTMFDTVTDALAPGSPALKGVDG